MEIYHKKNINNIGMGSEASGREGQVLQISKHCQSLVLHLAPQCLQASHAYESSQNNYMKTCKCVLFTSPAASYCLCRRENISLMRPWSLMKSDWAQFVMVLMMSLLNVSIFSELSSSTCSSSLLLMSAMSRSFHVTGASSSPVSSSSS